MSFKNGLLVAVVVAVLFAYRAAGAQIDLSSGKTVLAPVATVSFSPHDAGGMLGASEILASFGLVSFGRFDRASGTILLEQGSTVWLQTRLPPLVRVPLPNGLYSVQFAFTRISEPTTLTLLGVGGFRTQCSLSQQASWTPGAPLEICDSGAFQVADGKLDLSFRVTQAVRLTLMRITVNALRSPSR